MKITCPGCKTEYELSDSLAGKRLECSECGTKFIPAAAPLTMPEDVANYLDQTAPSAAVPVVGRNDKKETKIGILMFLVAIILIVITIAACFINEQKEIPYNDVPITGGLGLLFDHQYPWSFYSKYNKSEHTYSIDGKVFFDYIAVEFFINGKISEIFGASKSYEDITEKFNYLKKLFLDKYGKNKIINVDEENNFISVKDSSFNSVVLELDKDKKQIFLWYKYYPKKGDYLPPKLPDKAPTL